MTSKSPQDYSGPFAGLSIQRGLIYASILLGLEATIWGGLNFFLPEGWWPLHLVINILFFLIGAAGGVEIKKFIAANGKPSWLGYVAGFAVFFVAVLVWRSIVLEMLEGIF